MPIHLPRGFEYSGVHCGIKKASQKEDLALVVCRRGAVAAGVYTSNLVVAAPVTFDRGRTPADDIRVIATNSGNANACTGDRGFKDAETMANWAAEAIGVSTTKSLVMSTGIIGEFLPMEKIRTGMKVAAQQLENTEDAFHRAARAITTTDQYTKHVSTALDLNGREVRIAGMAKGAGMIGPRMATMLAIFTTDVKLSPQAAQEALQHCVARSFNCISVEGHMSTNDTVLMLASGEATERQLNASEYGVFVEALENSMVELAKMIPNDGEGASHLITIDIRGCASPESARQIAKTIAESALVKTAIAGADPNWGRILSAAGYAGVAFDPSTAELIVNGFPLFRKGAPVPFDPAEVSRSIKSHRETTIEMQFGEGTETCRFWTSDLNHEYIRVNVDYHT